MGTDPLVEKVAAVIARSKQPPHVAASMALAIVRDAIAAELRDAADAYNHASPNTDISRGYVDAMRDAAAMASGQGPDWPYICDSYASGVDFPEGDQT